MLAVPWEPLEVSFGGLEPSWGELEVVVRGFWGTWIFHAFGERFWNKKAPRGRQNGAKINLGSQSGAKINLGSFLEPLEAILGGLGAKFGWFWVTFSPPNFLNIF